MNTSSSMFLTVLLVALTWSSCQAFHTVPPSIVGSDRVGVGVGVNAPSFVVGKKNLVTVYYGSVNSNNDDNEQRLVVSQQQQQQQEYEQRKNSQQIVRRLAILGALETSYLTFIKLTSQSVAFCTAAADTSMSSCDSVLNSPYATLPLPIVGDIPLPAVGALAYTTVAILTTLTNSSSSILWTTALTTVMATFSCYLLSLLWFILHQSCTYCYISAALSISMALASWSTINIATTTDYDDDDDSDIITTEMISPKTLANMGISSLLSGTVAALFLFLSVGNVEEASSVVTSSELLAANGLPSSSTIIATEDKTKALRPPPITTTSSSQAIRLAKTLRQLDATMYGAYWCSHCYDQKQSFGQEAYYNYIRYVECSKDGFDSQTKLCKEKDVPGYPTWEIKGKLYPGEQSLEELEEIAEKAL